jgi:hypothetical protein
VCICSDGIMSLSLWPCVLCDNDECLNWAGPNRPQVGSSVSIDACGRCNYSAESHQRLRTLRLRQARAAQDERVFVVPCIISHTAHVAAAPGGHKYSIRSPSTPLLRPRGVLLRGQHNYYCTYCCCRRRMLMENTLFAARRKALRAAPFASAGERLVKECRRGRNGCVLFN